VGPILINPTSGNNSVSGTVSFQGTTPVGRLNVGLLSPTLGDYFTSLTSPAASQPFSISGVPNGTYTLFVFLDQTGCGYVCTGSWSNFVGPTGAPQIIVSGDSSGNTITMLPIDTAIYVGTDHISGTGIADSYGVNLLVRAGTAYPLSITLFSAPNVGVPYDMSGGPLNSFRPVYNGSVSPAVNDPYEIGILFPSPKSPTDVTLPVTEVLNTFATNLNETTSGVVGAVTLSRNVPEFAWAAPTAPPSSFTYSVKISDAAGLIWSYNGGTGSFGLPSTTTSAVFNSDGTASQPSLTTGVEYTYSVSVTDNLGNSATFVTNYTP
jgi:hypothetical protein